jgi:NAD+ dependent glucose-6-phosphate dehydrogenase
VLRIAVTGASGRVGQHLVAQLRSDYELTLLGRQPGEVHGVPIRTVDIMDAPTLEDRLRGHDAVVHLAGQAHRDSAWKDLVGPNCTGVVNVFEAARTAGVPRVLFASSNHVTGMYDQERAWPVSPSDPVRPDGLYGASKIFGEAVGRLFADRYGLRVICLRIGWVLPDPSGQGERAEEARMMWLSPGDLGRLVRGALAADVAYGIYYGVSNNCHRRWSIENASEDLKFFPQDNSEAWF